MATTGDVQVLLARYVAQLINGCGDGRCTEMQCHTGRLNSQHRPARRLTLRAARAIAFAICDGMNPLSHICQYFTGEPMVVRTGSNQRDPSSLVQQFIDTIPICQLFEPAETTLEPSGIADNPRQQIDALYAASVHLPGSAFVNNHTLAEALGDHLQRLIGRAPLTRLASWFWVDSEIISQGNAFPQANYDKLADQSYNTWLSILDVLDHSLYCSTLNSICRVVARRCWLEDSLVFQNPKRVRDPNTSICSMIASRLVGATTFERGVALVIWLKKLFAQQWNAKSIIERGSTCHGILELIRALHGRLTALSFSRTEIFLMRFVFLHLSVANISEAWSGRETNEVHLLHYRFLFPTDQLYLIFRTINHLEMSQAHLLVHQAKKIRENVCQLEIEDLNAQQRHAETNCLLLSVSRKNMLQDTFTQLWHRRRGELRRPLRVRLGTSDEELQLGQDLGGVQVEFFNLLCREILSEQIGMFTSDSKKGCSFFRAGSSQPLAFFRHFGVLLALAIYNGITLPITLPKVFYHYLIERTAPDSLHMLDDGWPDIAASLRELTDENVKDLDFTFDISANGLHLTVLSPRQYRSESVSRRPGGRRSSPLILGVVDHHPKIFDLADMAWPGWVFERATYGAEEVTAMNKDRYITEKIWWHTYASVEPQLQAALDGFESTELVPPSTLKTLFTASSLKSYTEGVDHLDINQLRATATYDDYDPKEEYIQSFWRIVSSWTQGKQKLLLKFVTAAERVPISGPSQLIFVIKRAANPELLPTSHTCFGTLNLPRYESSEVMAEKLSIAVMYGSEGFGVV